MIINLLCKALIAILDILLLDFYLKNIYPDLYKNKAKSIFFFFYTFIFIALLISSNIKINLIIYLLSFMTIIFILRYWKISIIYSIQKLSTFFFIKIFIYIFTNIFLSWIFNTTISFDFAHYTTLYTLLTSTLCIFISYILFSLKVKEVYNFKRFKLFSIFLFICFSITFILKNPILFYIPVIARTYIFTVVISIVALICFDRMQTKYETDKHNKEAIIQNMAKEEEFVQELEKQQLEIRKINHNLNHILIILQSHLKQGEYKEALEYIDKNLDIHIKAYQALTHTGMTMIDSTINHQIYQMKEQNIEYDEDITKILHLGSIVPDDLSLVLGLAFDNAREACEKVKDQRKISLKLQSKQTHIIIHITNSIPRGSHPYFHKTSKKDSVAHGYGVKGIKEIAKKYHGDVKYDVKDDCVVLRIMLQK